MLGAVQTTTVSPVFVGRDRELGTLRDALARAGAGAGADGGGAPQTLLLAGEAGVGKTRLVEEFAGRARRDGAVVAVGGCVETGADGLPFAAFSTALRALRRALPGELAAAAAGQEEELARLLPELGEGVTATGPARPDEEGTARLFDLTARLLERLAADRPLVLVLEDLHWADASTRHLVGYLLRTLRTGRLVVLATYRSDDLHRRHPLRPLLAELDRLRTVRRIDLAPFTREEVARQIAGILDRDPDPHQVDEIHARSDGNAFFVEELAAAARAGSRTAITDSLRDLLLVRLEALPENAQQAARIVAEGGPTVGHRLLAAVARLPEDDLIAALRAAVHAGVLLPEPEGDGYRFRHSLVREAVADDLLPGERSRLHRRCAEALEADPSLVPADERVMRLAGHWYHARDTARALPAVLDASVEARRRHAHAEQLRLLERALELWDAAPDEVRSALRPADWAEVTPSGGRGPGTGPLGRLDVMAEAVVAGRLCGERERALRLTRRALRLLEDPAVPGGPRTSDPPRAAWFWTQRSVLVQAQGRGDGRRELGIAEELVRGLPPSEVHAEVLAMAANWSMLHSPGPAAVTAAERAVEYARMVGAEDIELNARLTLGGLMVDAGHIEAGLAEMYRVKDAVVARGRAAVVARSHVNLPSVLESVGRSEEALGILREGVELTRRMGLLDSEAYVWGNLAESLISLGRWDEAVRAAVTSGAPGRDAGPRGGAALQRGTVALARGAAEEAARLLDEARAAFGRPAPVPQYGLPLATLAVGVAAAEGRLDRVRTELRAAVEAGFPPGTQRYGWPLLRSAAAAEADARGLPAAGEGRGEALACLAGAVASLTTGAPVWLAHDAWVRAELRRAEGRDTPGVWEEAVTAFERLERPYDLARVRFRLAGALLAAGDEDERARATELLRLAHTVAGHLGARPLGDAVARLARRARLTVGHGAGERGAGPAGALGLTGREREVLRLVAEGHTNRRIAEELFISPKTASVHVSNILAKLGVSGRGEAAAVAHRLALFPGRTGGPGAAD
ncbi:helix-turn-helix transcriptional regulator [Streptomyces tagetis]|uniref:AAA family ATPase n=1 Tax=Streptomyces tagetis TaxID=2820809 RepID=A0A940XCX2_9ACTN|nr:LuxR family transcriptional regulator [Streptomyces sp. RG38]MBQ0828018.1 AAA family ATPase [Streptomyces sp. RG38]